MAVEVSDPTSNAPEQIENAAKAIGRSKDRRAVFSAIYHGKANIKSAAEIAEKTKLTVKRVLEEGRILVVKGVVKEAKKDGRRAYQKIDFIHGHKARILSLAGDAEKLKAWPTKRTPLSVAVPKYVRLSTAGAKIKAVTIDDLEPFAKIKRVKANGFLGNALSEDAFKQGIKTILGEPGEFKDWGGETSDLYSSRATIKGKRRRITFAFKGPAKKGKLVPGMMGKNGDQIQRLFQEPADIFMVQYHGQIDASVVRQMQALALARWATTGDQVYYGVIDGADSQRLTRAYPDAFVAKAKKAKPKMSVRAKRR
jgi:hypothetical protein